MPVLRIVGFVLYALLAAEAYCWIFVPANKVGPTFTTNHPTLGRVIRPNASAQRWTHEYSMHWSTDDHGFRAPFPRGAARTWVSVGNSQSFGVGVNDEETYAAVLQALLTARDQDIQVINAATTDSGTGYPLLAWSQWEAMDAEVLLVRYDWFNIGRAFARYTDEGGTLKPRPAQFGSTWLETLVTDLRLDQSALLGFLRLRVPSLVLAIKESRCRYTTIPVANPNRCTAKPGQVQDMERRLLEALQQREAQSDINVVMLVGDLTDAQEEFLDMPLFEDHIDLRGLDAADPDMFYRIDGHMTPRAHAWIGERLASAMGDQPQGQHR